MAQGSKKHPVIKSWPVAGKLPRTGVHIVPLFDHDRGHSGALGLANDSCHVLVEKDPSKAPRLRIHDMGREHAGVSVDAARGKSSHCVEVRKLTSLAWTRLAKVEENTSQLISAETEWHGGHMRDPKRESSEMNVV